MARILVIDDEEVFCRLIHIALTKRGHTVVTCLSPLEGIEKVRQSSFDLALVDFAMPKLDGIETIKEIRSINKNVKTVIISGYARSIIEERLCRLEDETLRDTLHKTFLTKPINISKLRNLVDQLVGNA